MSPSMETRQSDGKQKQIMQQLQQPSRRRALLPKSENASSENIRSLLHAEEAKLAAMAISLNMKLRSADMPFTMQERALRHVPAVLDSLEAGLHRRPSPTLLARSLKMEFDLVYGPAWHCVVGKSFGSYVTHSPGGFVYFSVDSLSFLLFKTEVHLITEE